MNWIFEPEHISSESRGKESGILTIESSVHAPTTQARGGTRYGCDPEAYFRRSPDAFAGFPLAATLHPQRLKTDTVGVPI